MSLDHRLQAAAKRHESEIVYCDVLLTGEHAAHSRLLPLLIYQVSQTVSLLHRGDLDDGVFNHLDFAPLPVVVLLPTVGVHKLVRKLVLVEDKAVRFLWPRHNRVSQCAWVELKNPSQLKLSFELGGEVVESVHIVTIV